MTDISNPNYRKSLTKSELHRLLTFTSLLISKSGIALIWLVKKFGWGTSNRAFGNSTVLLIFFIPIEGVTQGFFNKANKEISFHSGSSTSKQTPFWLRSNQNGTVPFKSNYLAVSGRISKEYDSTYTHSKTLNKLNYGYGFEGFIYTNNKPIWNQGYFKVRHGHLELYAGRRQDSVGLVDSTLSSGSFAISNNAIPLPQIKLHLPNYIPILGKGLISIKGSFSHGWFGKQEYLKKVYLHHKSLYFKLAKESWKLKFYAGFNHQIQWGGGGIGGTRKIILYKIW